MEIVPAPANRKLVGCRWIYKVKYLPSGEVERYKARLVAKGYTQTEGVDYFDTFAPVAKMTTLRVILSLASIYKWTLTQLDVTNAFLNGDLQEEIYMALPSGYHPSPAILAAFPNQSLACKLIKSIYGLKQAPRYWSQKLGSALTDFGFIRTQSDHSLFIYRTPTSITVMLVYVDDMVLAGSDPQVIQDVKVFLSTRFQIKDLGHLKYFLGIEIAKSNDGLYLHQSKYVSDLLKDVGLSNCKESQLPVEQNHQLAIFNDDEPDIPDRCKDLLAD